MAESSLDSFLKNKKEVKKNIAKKLSFLAKKPLLGIILDKELSVQNEQCLKYILEGAAHLDMQVMILADTNVSVFNSPHTIALPYNRNNRKILLQAADMSLAFSFNDVEEMLLNGTIPISMARREIDDYNPNKESGNSFIYKKGDHWSIFATIVRAVETFKFPYDWTNIVRQGLETVLCKN